MIPIIMAFMRSYAPVIVLPVAAVLGGIGYYLESVLSDKHTPFKPSIEEQRGERLLNEIEGADSNSQYSSLKDKTFVPKSIFEKNRSPQFMNEKKL